MNLITPTLEAEFELAVQLARLAVKMTQPSAETRTRLRTAYEQDTAQLIAASQVAAIHFQTIAAANDYRRAAGDERSLLGRAERG